ncbi:TIGR02530 family flagellar biosynthesis protein [Lachnospiraceae bacterium HCP1S3_C3]|nr:flagellar protein [Lachnospiraceae bacterium]MDD6857505.1 flagellar protein [Lachnospiraceae bacterium]
MNIGNGFSSIEQVRGRYLRNEPAVTSSQSKTSFEDVLELKFSKHAGERLADRNISLTDEQLRRLEEGTKKAQAKGINESLVLMDDMAFIVNVKNNTIITAMNQQESAEKVYTNIDGAVII